ncbi:MAG: acetyl-CoA hydrolase/transferase C-terminal domain-containing protein [bacterium]
MIARSASTTRNALNLFPLIERGVVTGERKARQKGSKVVSSFVVDTQRLYEFAHGNPSVELRDSAYVNDTPVIRQNPKVTVKSEAGTSTGLAVAAHVIANGVAASSRRLGGSSGTCKRHSSRRSGEALVEAVVAAQRPAPRLRAARRS